MCQNEHIMDENNIMEAPRISRLARLRDLATFPILRQYIPVFIVVFLACSLSMTGLLWYAGDAESDSLYDENSSEGTFSYEGCNVVGIDIHGHIDTYSTYVSVAGDEYTEVYSQDIDQLLNEASENEDIKAVLLDIDSPGGTPQGALEIEQAIHFLNKPSVAWIRSQGTSAAYWAATAATTIVASPVSDVGSIGVTQSYIDNAKQNESSGITYNSLSTGPYKDVGDPDKSLTKSERDYLQKSLQIVLDVFVSAVAKNRNLPEGAVRALADGSSMTGEIAREKGLIDIVGGKQAALAELEKMVGERPTICWPQYDN